ncbi:hypothetical protein RRG08_050739 [Elysia crispata]|uniref:Uncharacterized protein n=1 Tax=Elysia crispata TaxID=231223 RepID=A0AAE0ZRW2_9GAST|nr:hypothetical protein RRG08_050739 [Elysia crispata]
MRKTEASVDHRRYDSEGRRFDALLTRNYADDIDYCQVSYDTGASCIICLERVMDGRNSSGRRREEMIDGGIKWMNPQTEV